MPWGVGARVLWGLWAVGAMHMLNLFCICLAFMGQGFLVWCGLPRVLQQCAVGLGCHSNASAWGDLTQHVGNQDRGALLGVSQQEMLVLRGRWCCCGVWVGLGAPKGCPAQCNVVPVLWNWELLLAGKW